MQNSPSRNRYMLQIKGQTSWLTINMYEFKESAMSFFRTMTLDGHVVRIVNMKTGRIIAE